MLPVPFLTNTRQVWFLLGCQHGIERCKSTLPSLTNVTDNDYLCKTLSLNKLVPRNSTWQKWKTQKKDKEHKHEHRQLRKPVFHKVIVFPGELCNTTSFIHPITHCIPMYCIKMGPILSCWRSSWISPTQHYHSSRPWPNKRKITSTQAKLISIVNL